MVVKWKMEKIIAISIRAQVNLIAAIAGHADVVTIGVNFTQDKKPKDTKMKQPSKIAWEVAIKIALVPTNEIWGEQIKITLCNELSVYLNINHLTMLIL